MQRFLRVVLFTGFAANCGIAKAETPPRDLEKARAAFADALASKDLQKVIELTQFPLHNVEYLAPQWISRAVFPKYFKQNGYFEFANCIRMQPMKQEGYSRLRTWYANCDGNIFYFSKIGEKWLHTKYENINE